ncbi:hypothetical protein ACWCXL_12060 [Streptomyces sp. NPDC001588]
MRRTRRRLAVEVVRDVAAGSVILARLGTARLRSGHAAARRLTGNRAPAGQAKTEAEAEAAPGAPKGEQSAAAGNAGREVKRCPRGGRTWTLETLAVTVVAVWVGWCFVHRPAAVSWHAAAPYAAMLWPWALLGWMVAALCAAQRHKRSEGTGQPLEAVAAGPDGAEVLRAERWFRHLVISRVAEAVSRGRKGIHLRALLQEPGIPESWDVTTVRQHCERVGIPHRPMTIRGEGTGPTHGVHVDDLTHTLGMPIEQALARYDSDGSSTSAEAPLEGPLEGSAGTPSETRSGGPLAWLFGTNPRRPTGPARTPRSAPLPAPSPPPPERG